MGATPDRAGPGLLLGALALVLASCAGAPDPGASGEPGRAATGRGGADGATAGDEGEAPPLRVVVTLAPLADLVASVGGDRVEVAPLVPPGTDAHTYEPRPSDVARLEEADAFVGVGLGLNPGIVSLAEQSVPEASLVLLGERFLAAGDLVRGRDDGDRHAADGHDHGQEGDGHAHAGPERPATAGTAGVNPHVWTSPALAATLVDGIGESLAGLDPQAAPGHRRRARRLRAAIEDLDERIRRAVATIPEEDRTLLVYHDAWAYFARDYGLELVTAVQPADYSAPSAGHVRDIIDLIRAHEVPALFGSEGFPSRVMETIADESGAVYVADLADDALPGESGDPEHSYVGLLRRNAARVVDGLGGDADPLRG